MNLSVEKFHDPTPNIQFWIYGLILPIISVCGIFANFISIAIFTQKQMRSAINTYLAGLSCYDFCVLLFATTLYPSMTYCFTLRISYACHIFQRATLVLYPLSLMARFGSVWTCVFITFDRFVAVAFPLQQRSWSSMRNAGIILCAISVFAVLYCVPTLFELRLDSEGWVERTELRKSWTYRFWYKANLNLVVLLIVPWAIMITLNMFIIRTIRMAFQRRGEISGNRGIRGVNEERRSTKIAVLVCTTLLISNVLSLVNNYIHETDSQYSRSKTADFYVLKRTLVFLGNALVCLNSATNFLIYCALVPTYRRRFLVFFCRGRHTDGGTSNVELTAMNLRQERASLINSRRFSTTVRASGFNRVSRSRRALSISVPHHTASDNVLVSPKTVSVRFSRT